MARTRSRWTWITGFAALAAPSGLQAIEPVPPPPSGPKVIREVENQGYRLRLDLSGQVLRVSIPEDRSFGEGKAQEAPILPTLPPSGGLVSASILAQKAKQFDDGLYAAVEIASQKGAGSFGGKSSLLQALAEASARTDPGSGNASIIVLAAARLGGLPVTVPAALGSRVDFLTTSFLGNEVRSKPISFYTWSPELQAIFRQDRMLQAEMEGNAGIEALARALHADSRSRKVYDTYLGLIERLTNPLKKPDWRGLLAELDAGRSLTIPRGLAVFPPSRAHETDLVMRLYGNRPIPQGFNLADEMIRRIRSDSLQLAPTTDSGWYDYQTWSLEPLVIPERMPEASRLRFNDEYRKQLVELFKGIIALTRETHIKQLEIPPPGAAAPGGEEKPRVILYQGPDLPVEPLPTHYLRRAQGYQFVRGVLEKTFGVEGLRSMRRLTAAGPVAEDLDTELRQMERLFRGAYAATAHNLGMATETESDITVFRDWSAKLSADPDLGRDARMMVPVFFDQQRQKTKVWAFLGWCERPVSIGFESAPKYIVTKDGKPLEGRDAPEVQFVGQYGRLAYPVTAEVYVSRILDRDEFRRHCDRYVTRKAILDNLR